MKFQQSKGNRIKKNIFSMQVISKTAEEAYVWCESLKKWCKMIDYLYNQYHISLDNYNHQSLKACMRHIRKSNLPKGTKVLLCSRYVKNDIIITKK